MQNILNQYAAQGIQNLAPYIPGKPIEELQRELGLTHILKLASNENPLGASPKAQAAVQAILQQGDMALAFYPDGSGYKLKQNLSQKFNISPEQITLGNGSNEILELVTRVFINKPSDEVLFSQYAFAVYPIVTQIAGGTAVEAKCLPLDNEQPLGHDLDALLAAITANTRIIFIANPNNPTGTWLDPQKLAEFIAKIPNNIVIVLDEAYYEYIEPKYQLNSIELLAKYENLIITRTFSKIYGLAGLRIGYGFASLAISDWFNRARQPFNANSLALAAAEAAVNDDEFVAQSIAMNNAGLLQLKAGLSDLGLKIFPSQANFITVDVARPAKAVYDALLQAGIIVRPLASYGLPTMLRITVGNQAENQAFLTALAGILNQ